MSTIPPDSNPDPIVLSELPVTGTESDVVLLIGLALIALGTIIIMLVPPSDRGRRR